MAKSTRWIFPPIGTMSDWPYEDISGQSPSGPSYVETGSAQYVICKMI